MKNRIKRTLTISMFVAGIAGPAIVHSQALDEILVTAQKRQQSVQDVPISVSAFSGEQVRNLGIDSTLDLALYTPGLTMGQNSGDGDFPFISIRGVSQRDFSDINESPSAVYVDEFYKANLIGLDQQIFDIDRVEVLRGPQGTLYGRNATGGLIHYITAKPTDESDGYVDLTVGENGRVKLEGAVSGPLSETVGARLSVLRHEYDGWVENSVAGAEDGNALENTSLRGQLLFNPSETFSVGLMFQHSENDNEAGNMFQHVSADDPPPTFLSIPNLGQPGFGGFLEPTPNDPRDTHSNRDIFLETEQTTWIGRVEWSYNDIDFVSITGHEQTSKDATFDSDGTPFERGTEVHPEAEQVSQELRVSGESGSVTWLAGIYYIDYDVDGTQSRCSPGSCATNRLPVVYELSTESLAVFGNMDYSFTDQLSLTLGLRYTDEQKEYRLNNRDTGLVFNSSTVGDLAKLDEDNVDFNVRINWTPNDDMLVFGGVSRAHKAGLFNLGFTARDSAIPGIPVGSETLTAYEIGFKSDFSDGRSRLNGAVFYYDYDDSQAFQFDGTTLSAQAFNSDAEITGAELELSITPAEGLDFIANLTYMDAELQDVTLFGLQVVDTQMPLTPELQGSLIARYEWPAWGGRLVIQGDLSWFDDQYFDSFNSPSHFEDSYSIANARVTWFSGNDKWRVSVFGENVADEEYRTFSFDLAFLGFSTDVYGKPSWFGATVGYNF